jgi:predicted membrane-bound mannosyltransferase
VSIYCVGVRKESDIGTKPFRRDLILYGCLFIVLAAASGVRLYRLTDFPLGAFVDEIFMLNSSLLLGETPFDPFGHTLQISQSWGQDHPNLFLYLNLLILKIFGVSYWSMKLLSVIPGVIAAGLVFLIMERLFDKPVALAASLLFAFAQWPVRLSRYGWDVSLMLMTFAAAVWFLVLTMQNGRLRYAVYAGIAAGLSLYSYLGGRIILFSLLVFLGLECVVRRDRQAYRDAAGFAAGAAAPVLLFLSYYVSSLSAFWARTSEVSVFNNAHPLSVILTNITRHTLMFHWKGGTFARDNFPGLPMVDPLTGALLLGGLIIIVNRRDTLANLIGFTFLLNMAGGIFSISQEGAPYVYRTAAVIIPVFLLVAVGMQWLVQKIGIRWLAIATCVTILLNLYLYFGLEAKNLAAMRVMAYEPRLLGLEIARDNGPVWLVSPDVLTQSEIRARSGERYPKDNPAVIMPPGLRRLAIINFSGRYDMHQTVAGNLERPKDIFFVEARDIPAHGPAKIIFNSNDRQINEALARDGVSLRYVRNIFGEPLYTVAAVPASN